MNGQVIDTLLLDLDNTLIDRNRAMRLTMDRWLSQQGYAPGQRAVALNAVMQADAWGYTSRQQLCEWLLHTYGGPARTEVTAASLLPWILSDILEHIVPDTQVQECLQKLSTRYRLVLATNGGSATQRGKLQRAGLDRFFEHNAIFISAEMGVQKPDPRFFQNIVEALQLVTGHTMMIGDHPEHDILAAQQGGLNTCWVSHGRQWRHQGTPGRVITHLTAWNE